MRPITVLILYFVYDTDNNNNNNSKYDLSYIISEIKRYIGQKSPAFSAPVRREGPLGIVPNVWYGKTKIAWLYPTVKTFDDVFSRFDTIPACDGRTDGHLASA